MKRTAMLRLFRVLLAAALLLTLLAACGGEDRAAQTPAPAVNPAVGIWEGEYAKFVGDSEETKNTEAFTLVLEEEGVGRFQRNGNEYKVAWTLEGEAFTMKETFAGISIDYTGVLKEGRLDLFNGDPEDMWTCEYVFALKQN